MVAPGVDLTDDADVKDEPADCRGAGHDSAGVERTTGERSRAQEVEVARAMALRSLEASAKTRAQLGQRLRRGGISDDVACEVLDRFEVVGLVDDDAFAWEWVRSRHASRGLAPRALRQELIEKGVDVDLISGALSQIDSDDERVAARQLAGKLMRKFSALDRVTTQRRLAGRLARRGYSVELVNAIVTEQLAKESAKLGGDITITG